MRIGIDARFLSHPQRGGFKTYTENLVAALAELASGHTFVVYTDRPVSPPGFVRPGFEVKPVLGSWPSFGLPWREQVGLPWQVWHDRLDLLHSPAQTAPLACSCRLVVTMHDTFSIAGRHYPSEGATLHERLLSAYLRVVGRHAAERAAHILTVSRTSKEALVRELGLAPERVSVAYEAASPRFAPMEREGAAAHVAHRFGLRAPFLLHLGSADGRKNTRRLLQAYAALSPEVARGHDLVVVGRPPATEDPPSGRIHRVGAVTDDDLVHLYNAASVFVVPSLDEGFGLPALEAMACGTPVIASDNSAMPEILGDAAVLVSAEDPKAITQAIERIVGDPDLRRELVRRGRGRAAQFSWRRCAEETLAVYDRLSP